MKKDKDKTEKKEKKERKEGKTNKNQNVKGAGLTADELLRLDEVRRSLKLRTRRKDKEKLPSGITADYTANFNLEASAASASSTSTAAAATSPDEEQLNSPSPLSDSETSLNSLSKDASGSTSPPIPPSRGILKGKSSYGIDQILPSDDLEDDNKLVENTLKNELIIYEKPPSVWTKLPATNGAAAKMIGDDAQVQGSMNTVAGEGHGWAGDYCGWKSSVAVELLTLPPLLEPQLPEPRDLTLFRKESGDFGFSLRRSIVVERSSNQQLNKR